MELFIGTIIFLYVLTSIQHMLTHKEVLRQIKRQNDMCENIYEILKTGSDSAQMDEARLTVGEQEETGKLTVDGQEEAQLIVGDAEILINEVLSEVFS